jgi:hypothetical protein
MKSEREEEAEEDEEDEKGKEEQSAKISGRIAEKARN